MHIRLCILLGLRFLGKIYYDIVHMVYYCSYNIAIFLVFQVSEFNYQSFFYILMTGVLCLISLRVKYSENISSLVRS